MTEETIRASEEELLVFISSRQDEEMNRARALATETVNNYPGMRIWAFEDAPASSEGARERYIRNAGKADFVIWLIGSTTSPPVVEEIDACLQSGRKLLPFKLPAQRRDCQTQELIKRVQEIVTWREVEDVETLPDHIEKALTDEMVRGVRDPAPLNHDLYLKLEQRGSIAETKRLWTTLGVRDDIAQNLADDQSIGHKLDPLATGVLQVVAAQGSGKTLAAHRLYQHAIEKRLESHFEPLPVFLNARHIQGELKDDIEKAVGEQGSVYTQRILVIIDGLDETGRHEANQILGKVESYTNANQNVAAVVMSRLLPGLKSLDGAIALPGCSDEEFLSIASRVAGRSVHIGEVPYRVAETRIPLFAVIIGAHFRDSRNPMGTSLSQMISQLVQRILEESDDYPEEKAEPLKKLAIACTNSGENVNKAEIDPKSSVHAHLAGSRLVVEENDKIDFVLAIFREWFAARALVERTILPSDVDLTSDRWVIPLAIAINSENASLSSEIMEVISTKDPGIAGLVLDEVKHSWSMEYPPEHPPDGTAIEMGHQIRQAMSNWKEGLGPLMTPVGPTSPDGDISTLSVEKGERMVTTRWYRGEEQMDSVVEIPPGWDPYSYHEFMDWYPWRSTVIEHTRVWPWTITQETLSSSLSELLKTYTFALDSTIGIREFAAEFAETIPTYLFSASRAPKVHELSNRINEWITEPGRGPKDSIGFGQHSYTVKELELIRATLPGLPRSDDDTISDLWPGKDKPWPAGRGGVLWHELYTDVQLLDRTNAIFDGALRIYNNIVERWFPTFNRRHQMSYMLPLRLEGVLIRRRASGRREWNDAVIDWWPRLVNSNADSGVSFELGAENKAFESNTREKRQAAQDEFFLHRGQFRHTSQLLPGNDPRPATKLAHDWLTTDLESLHWL